MAGAISTNDHIQEYLTYYVTLPYSPHYAVMLNGPWGIGKTYLIKQFLKENADKIGNYVYVSLYGLTSIEEIDSAVLQALFPALGWKVTKIGARIGATALKYIGVNDDKLKFSDLVNRFEADLFVFDDLERCEAPINKTLGYINEFVEHAGCKVIVLANEIEIEGSDYKNRREKIFGKTLEVQSAFDEAFRHFVSLIDDKDARDLFGARQDVIASVYLQSKLDNLRILQQAMWDFERLFKVLRPAHRANREAMGVLLQFIFALSFELKSGRIATKDLDGRMNNLVLSVSRRERENASAFSDASKRYVGVNLNDTILSDQVLIDFLIKGIVDQDAVRSCLDRSVYFISSANEEPWQTIWHWFDRTDDEFSTALTKMENQFVLRQFVEIGVLLHVFGLRLFLARIGLLKTVPEVVRQGKQYVDDLYAAKHLDPLETSDFDEFHSGGYGGLGIHDHDTAEYRELFQYLKQKRQQASIDTYPERALNLLGEMAADPESYSRKLSPIPGGGSLSRTPLLATINPDDFAASVLKQPPSSQHTILKTFYFRYEHDALTRDLAIEKGWLLKVRKKLLEKGRSLPPIGQYRLQQNVKQCIDAVLPKDGPKTTTSKTKD